MLLWLTWFPPFLLLRRWYVIDHVGRVGKLNFQKKSLRLLKRLLPRTIFMKHKMKISKCKMIESACAWSPDSLSFVIQRTEKKKKRKAESTRVNFFSEKDYKRFYWFNKNEGLLHCQSFICPMSQKGQERWYSGWKRKIMYDDSICEIKTRYRK